MHALWEVCHGKCRKIEKKTKIDIANSTHDRRTRFDMYFLGQLLPALTVSNAIRTQLYYYPNSSLYTVLEQTPNA
jgi:lantibiotic biosynthesis protein